MNGIVLRWGVPALLTVVGGTSLAISSSGATMVQDLGARATAVLTNEEFGWASVSFDARDAVLSGTASNQQMIDAALERVAAVHGVRSVRSEVVLAEYMSPFPFAAEIRDGAITLSGGVPDETAHAEILLETGASRDDLRLLSGAPQRESWRAAVDYGLRHLREFEEGEFTLADLEITINGRAKSTDSFDSLMNFERESVPEGVRVAQRQIIPPLASPFEWHATFDGTSIAVSGHTPSEAFAERLRTSGVGGHPVSTSLVLASGAPEGFEATAMRLLESLVLLEEGRAEISDDAARLIGAPADQATAEKVQLAMAPLGVDVSLEPARVDTYEFVATRSGGVTVLTGLAPDAATRDRLEALEGVDAAGLELARGAPARFDSGVEFGLDLLGHLSEGHFTLRNTSLAIEGRAKTASDYAEVETTLALGAPQGLILRSADIRPPLAGTFLWSATKAAEGGVSLAGFVPSAATRSKLRAAIPDLETDRSAIADGAPEGFETQAVAALGVLELLQSGTIEYDGRDWSMSGTVTTPDEAFAAERAFAEAGLREAGWSLELALAEPPAADVAATDEPSDTPIPAAEGDAIPVASPYTWSATKADDGRVSLAGYVPTEELKRFIVVRAGAVAGDTTEVASGEPAGFATDVLAGLEALGNLSTGSVTYADGVWTIAGTPKSAEAAELAVAALGETTVGAEGWRNEIGEPASLPESGPAAEPTVTVTPEPPAVERDFVFAARKALGGAIELSGAVPADAARRFFGVIAGGVPTDGLTIAATLPEDFILNADAGIRLLTTLDAGEFGLDGESWVLAGRVENAAERRAALDALAAIPAAADWQTDISLLAPIELCRQHVAAFATRNAILFRSGSAQLAEESFPAIDELAGYLAECPEATVHVEGHTDADGDDELNLALSVARAETVVEALIERGVGYQRLYAVGYGESLPIADNNTAAGKRANRRIAFTIEDGHE